MRITGKVPRLSTRRPADLEPTLRDLRRRFERAFSPDTAAPGFSGLAPSTGHCAAVSAIVAKLVGASMVSTRLADQSHWFNRLRVGETEFDFDLTGDQYGLNAVQYAEANALYPDTRVRSPQDLNADTLARARRLAARAGFQDVARRL